MTVFPGRLMTLGVVILSFFGRWWGSTVHLIHLNTDSRRWEWIEYRGPLGLITNFAWIVDASFQTKFFHYNNLTVLPCSLDGFPPPPTRCGTLDGIHNRWDFKGNLWRWYDEPAVTSSVSAQTQAHLLILGSKIPSWINNWRHKLSLISSTLQQLVPFHQPTPHPHSTSTPPTPQPTPQASEPPTPVAPPSTQTGSSASFNPEEMMQQMEEHGRIQFQRSMNQLPPPSHAPIPVPPQTSSHFHPPDDVPTSHQRSHRRSRSQRHRSGSRRPDKRPVSIPRSPRRHRSTRRTRRSSRSRSSSRRRLSTSRRASRRPSRATSITLRPASPRHREVRRRDQDDHTPQESTHTPATLQPATWEHHPQVSHYNTNTQSHYYHHDQYTTNKWQSRGQWKDYPKSQIHPMLQVIDYTKPPASHHTQYDSSTKPLTAFSSDSNTTYLQQNRPITQVRFSPIRSSTTVPPGHVAINLQDGSKDEWVRNVRFALSHPEKDASSQWNSGCRTTQADNNDGPPRLWTGLWTAPSGRPTHPSGWRQKNCPTIFSVPPSAWLRPIHLPRQRTSSHQHSCLIMPVPDTSHFQMPPPLANVKNHTWALLHGTSLHTSQQILLEGKIRPANWSYHRNLQRCELPTFGAFYLGRGSIQQWQDHPTMGGERASRWYPKERKRTARHRHRGDVPRINRPHRIQSWRQWVGSARCGGKRNCHHVWEVHDCPQQPCGIEIRCLSSGKTWIWRSTLATHPQKDYKLPQQWGTLLRSSLMAGPQHWAAVIMYY